MIRRIVVLALLIGSALLLEPLRVPTEGVIAPRSLFLFGVLLLVADTLGTLMKGLGLPRIVGYLLAGMVLGPSVANMVPVEVLGDLGLMKQLALGLIGLLAGAELRMRDVQERWRGILYILLGQTLLVFLFVVPVTLLAREWIPFAAGLSLSAAFTVALLFASMLALNSPMVTIALLTETGAQGPVAKTSLGVVLVADVLGIVLFTVMLSLAQATLGAGGGGEMIHVLGGLIRSVILSLLAGAIIAGIVALYLRFVRLELVLVAIVVVFVTTALGAALHFEVLLSLLVAGFLLENVAPVKAEPLHEALHQVSWPVFVVFFALAGAELELERFLGLWPIVAGFVVLRGAALYLGARFGARLAGTEPVVERQVWTGLLPQAGVALGLVVIVMEQFPDLGAAMQATVVGIIAVNQVLGPILFRRSLLRSGEVVEAGEAPNGAPVAVPGGG